MATTLEEKVAQLECLPLLVAELQEQVAALRRDALLRQQPAAAAAGRGSDDASHKGQGSSPKQSAASVTTVALADARVTLASRFPHIQESGPVPVASCLEDEAMQFAMEFILETPLTTMSMSKLDTEAAYVHVVAQMLQAALVLFPGGARFEVDQVSAAEEVALIKEKDREEYMGYEKHIRAGSFRGRVELQVVRPHPPYTLYTGAIEVKLPHGKLEDHIDQAKKEAFAMWCHNAMHQSYEPVWVVLTNLEKVLRVTYDGHNHPGGGAATYFKGISCADVRGQVKLTASNQLFIDHSGVPCCCRSSREAVAAFIGGLAGASSCSVATLRQLAEQHKEKAKQRLDSAMEPPTKRARMDS